MIINLSVFSTFYFMEFLDFMDFGFWRIGLVELSRVLGGELN